MTRAKKVVLVILVFTLVFSACTKKSAKWEPEYKEPLSFEIFKLYPDMILDSTYVRKVFDAWNYELKDDETIKEHTWFVGDYHCFVYNHGYIYGMLNTRHDEVLFLTTTQPKKGTDKVHCTVTVFQVDLMDPDYEFSRINTYVFENHYHPLVNETEAKNTMLYYLEQYLDEYRHDTYNDYLLREMRETLENDLHIYLENWKNHYVFYEPPNDFGGAIIVNKLTSKLVFLGSSVWMGYGTRYFPSNESTQ